MKNLNRDSISLRNRLILIVYVLAFTTGLFCAWQSIETTQSRLVKNAYDTALNEQFRIGYAIKKMAENYNYSKEAEGYFLLGTIRNSAISYADYYGVDSSYRITNGDNGTIYSNIPDEYILLLDLFPTTDGTVNYVMKQSKDKTLIFVSSYIKIYQSLFRLDYIQDVTNLRVLVASLANKIAVTLFLVEILLLATLYLTIKKALLPLNNLKNQAIAISQGDYDLRAKIIHNDEVGQLATSYNDMADAVQEHIHTLSESARLKELFASDLAHEIKTPITSIVAYSDYAARTDVKKEELHKLLEYIKREGQRIGELSDKILRWSSINHHNEIDVKPCRPQRIIDQCLYTLRPVAEQKNQVIKVENHTEIIFSDEALLVSLITNLCKNALNASDNGSSINLIIINDKDGSLCIKVIDTGIGIEKDELKRIMEPFYMVDKARDRAKGGAGLGLSLCSAITAAHNGRMEIESMYGRGTCVTIKIPQNKFEFTT